METDLDLKGLERSAWRSVFEDGLWDIMLGCVFLGVGIAAILQHAIALPRGLGYLIQAASTGIGVAVSIVGKRRITIPRLGWVDFGARGRTRRRKAIILLAVAIPLQCALMLLALVFRPGFPAMPDFAGLPLIRRTLIGLPIGGMIFLILALLAVFLDFRRLQLYALILGVAFMGTEMSDTGYPLLAGALIVLAIGVVHLRRFIRRYPAARGEVNDAGA